MSSHEKNLELLRNSLLHNNPNLFIGAGFSLGALQKNRKKLPNGDNLKKELLTDLLGLTVDSSEYKQLDRYSLPKVCTYVVSKIGKKRIYEYLQIIFQDTIPDKFHYSFIKYPWNKIFSTNIDDVLEKVYEKSKKHINIQNGKHCSTKSAGQTMELFKLHGCVNNLDEGLIFDEEEYINSLLDIQDYRFGTLSVEIQNKDFIFVGSNYDDFNIKYYLNLYASTTFTSARGQLFFINPFPDVMFESEIDKVNGILIKYTTEEFSQLLESIVISKDSIDEVKLKSDGYIQLKEKKLELPLDSISKYNSNLFIGSHPLWEDIFFDWDVRIKYIENDFDDKLLEFEHRKDNSFINAIVSKGYSGKSVILKRLANCLIERGYNVISYEGSSFSRNRFLNYIKETSYDKYALVIDDGSYLYNQMESIQRMIDKNKKIVILTASRPYYHSKRKYSLIDCYYKEYELDIRIDNLLSEAILDKIDEKGYLGVLSKLKNREEQLNFIKSGKDIASVIFEINNGKDFKKRFRSDTGEILQKGNYREVLIKLAIFDKLELPYFPKDLLVNIYKNKVVGIINRIDDVIRNDYNKTRFNLKNSYITEFILKESSKSEILNNLKELLIHISPFVDNFSSSYWNEIQSILMRDKLVKKQLKMNKSDLKDMLYKLKGYYSTNYNYWLQLGIAEQQHEDYDKALNHFIQAEALGPNSYMVKNAIGKNYILQSINESNLEISKTFFFKGKEILFDLIKNKEENQVKAYSIHSYIGGLISFYTKHRTIKIGKKEIKESQELLANMLEKNENDPLFNKINQSFNRFLIKINSGNVTLNLQELKFINTNSDEDQNDDIWEY